MSQLKNNVVEADLDLLPIVGPQPESEKEEEYLKEMCEYEFFNLEEPGLSLTFPYGNSRFKKNFKFFHGGTYLVPRHVARHVESRATPMWDYRPDGAGRMQKQKIGTKSRFQMRQKFGG